MSKLDCNECARPIMPGIRAMQQEVLELVARDYPLGQIMNRLCAHAERLAKDAICSILALDREGRLHPVAAPSLPAEYSSALDGLEIGASVGSCGTAAFLGEQVEVTDIEHDPLWADFKHLALPLGLRACWSSPIFVSDGRVAGAFAFYFRSCRGPSDVDRGVVDACLNLCAIAFDQADRKTRIEQLAYHDPLTGAFNRTYFEQQAPIVIASALDNDSGITLHWIDLDRFKALNDALGHRAGDVVLKNAAGRIRALLKAGDILARIGGDEFVVLQSTSRIDEVEGLGRRIVASASDPFEIDGSTISTGLSVGAARAPQDGRDLTSLMKRADLALYQSKAAGRGRFSLFEPRVEAEVVSRWQTEQDLKSALGSNQFELHFQPVVDIRTVQITGFEALIRWRRPGYGLIRPIEFLSIAEKSGLINPIGDWVLQEACSLATRLPMSMRIAVNLSALQLLKPTFALDVAKALSQTGLSPSKLELEITESTFLLEEKGTVACLKDIRDLGVSIALDDFGTGFSTLSHLRAFSIDRIKIDKSFVEAIDRCRTTASIVRGLIAIARDLGVRTTAEGVETKSQLCALKEFGCDEIQGYLIGRPKQLDFYLRQIEGLTAAS